MSGYEIDDAFKEVMGRRAGDTKWAMLEIFLLGEAVLNWVVATTTLGHTRPGHTLDYDHPTGEISHDLLRDFIAWTSGRTTKAPGCEERVRAEIVESGWTDFCHQKAAANMFPEGWSA